MLFPGCRAELYSAGNTKAQKVECIEHGAMIKAGETCQRQQDLAGSGKEI